MDSQAIQKLRPNEPLTEGDLAELESILTQSGSGTKESIDKASESGLGLFVRSLIGLDRGAAKSAFNDFLSNESMTATQIEFVNMIIDYLTEHGVMEPRMLYESPFTDISPLGPDSIFESSWIDRIVNTLHDIRERATVRA